MEAYEKKVAIGGDAVEEDMVFHIKIAKATKNSVIESMILILVPDLIKNIVENKICGDNRAKTAIEEHRMIYAAIESGHMAKAEEAMAGHLDEIWQISKAGFAAQNIIEKAEI